jgi:hypothetical protein
MSYMIDYLMVKEFNEIEGRLLQYSNTPIIQYSVTQAFYFLDRPIKQMRKNCMSTLFNPSNN